MADVSDLVDFFVAVADVYDAAVAALNNATELSMAVSVAASLQLPPDAGCEYEERGELFRLQAVFETVASRAEELAQMAAPARKELIDAIAYVERVQAAHRAVCAEPRDRLRHLGRLEPPKAPALALLRELLWTTEESVSSDAGDDMRFAAARLRPAVAPKKPKSLESYLALLPRSKQTASVVGGGGGVSFDVSGAAAPVSGPAELPTNLADELEQMSSMRLSAVSVRAKPVEDNSDLLMQELEGMTAPTKQQAREEPIELFKDFAPTLLGVARPSSSNPAKKMNEMLREEESGKTTQATAVAALASTKRQSAAAAEPLEAAKPQRDVLEFLDALTERVKRSGRSAETTSTTGEVEVPSFGVLEVQVKKVFSAVALKGEEKKKEKKSKKVDKEKAKMEKLMKESGMEVNQKAQQELLAAATPTLGPRRGSGSSSITAVDTEPVLFVRFVQANGTKRNSNFVLASDPAAKEDTVRLPLQEGAIEVYLMGCSGVFGPGGCVMLGMNVFDSPAHLVDAKLITLRCGRHTFELRASIVQVPETVDAAQVVMTIPEATRSKLPTSFAERNETLGHFRTLLTGLQKQVPASVKTGNVELQIRQWADLGCDLDGLCNLIVAHKYMPAAGLRWQTTAGNHLLHLACLSGHAPAVAHLLHYPNMFPVETKNNFGANCMHYAVLGGSRECVALLLLSLPEGKDMELVKTMWLGKKTPLHLAAILGRADIAAELLRGRKGLLEVADLTGSTPLSWAAFVGSIDMIQLLCKAGASLLSEDEDGNTPLGIALLREFQDVIAYIVCSRQGLLSVGKKNLAGDTPLWLALCTGNIDSVTLISQAMESELSSFSGDGDSWIDADLQVTYQINGKHGDNSNTLLHRAVMFLPDRALPVLIRAMGPSLKSEPNVHKQHPLHIALALGKLEAAAALPPLAGDDADAFGNTALHYALTGRSVDWVMKNRPATKPEVKNFMGLTPLMHALACGSHDAISALLGIDCDPSELYNGRLAISLLEVRPKTALCIPYADGDEWVAGAFRIPLPAAVAASASTQDKKQLVQGLSRRGSMTIRKGASSATVIAIGNSKF